MNATPHTVADAVEFLTQGSPAFVAPKVGIILGSGLGGLAEQVERPRSFQYLSIPGFAKSTASGHRGELILGEIGFCPIVAMAGRLHRYEGWTNDETGFPVRVMHALGARTLIVSNAAGGVNPKFKVGDIVALRDHIQAMSSIALGGTFSGTAAANPLGMGSPQRSQIYDPGLRRLAITAAMQDGFTVSEGTYLATLGPTYETRSEYRMMRKIGADMVGMSTVPEVIVAASLGMKILGLSMISNVANPDRAIVASHEEVLVAGRQAAAKMETIVRATIAAE